MADSNLTTLFTNIANSIRTRSGVSGSMYPRQMGNRIRSIRNVPSAAEQTTLNGILSDIAVAIRACGVSGTMTPSQMADKVLLIPAQQASLVIQAEDTFTGKTTYCKAYYNDELVTATWSITSGGSYATINSNGRVDVVSGTVSQNITVSCTYGGSTVTKTMNVSYDNQLTIQCADTITGTDGNVVVTYNGEFVSPDQTTFTVTSGGSHASIDSNGTITIISSGTIVLQASYNGYTTSKSIVLNYVANTSSQTTVNEDGSVTTETQTTTQNQDGSTTTETTSTTTNEDGSYSQNATTTTQNQDGSSTTTSSTTNSDGTSSQTTSSTSAPDSSGSTTTTSATTNYDENGDVSGSQQSQKTSNSDGSSQSTTTNYNANGDPTDKTNQTTDTSGNENTQNIEFDENGNEEVTGYVIDTTNNPSGTGEAVTSLDTGMIVFDGKAFTMHLKFVMKTSENASNFVFSALQQGSTSTKYSGFEMLVYSATRFNFYGADNSTINKNTGVCGSLINTTGWNISTANSTKRTTYTMEMTYTPVGTGGRVEVDLSPLSNYSSVMPFSKSSAYFPESLDNATFTLGGSVEAGTNFNAVNFEVLEFTVQKVKQ